MSWIILLESSLVFGSQVNQWPLNDLLMTAQWPLNDRSMTAQWPLNKILVACTWHSLPGSNNSDISWRYVRWHFDKGSHERSISQGINAHDRWQPCCHYRLAVAEPLPVEEKSDSAPYMGRFRMATHRSLVDPWERTTQGGSGIRSILNTALHLQLSVIAISPFNIIGFRSKAAWLS